MSWRKKSGQWMVRQLGRAVAVAAVCGSAWTGLGDPGASGVLQFLDGSVLHGELLRIDPEEGVIWKHGASRQPIAFQQSNIARIQFDRWHEVKPLAKPNCVFRFGNGDEFFGVLKDMDTNHVELATWFGAELKAERGAVRAISFLSPSFRIVYEGPQSLDEWTAGQTRDPWRFEGNALVTEGVAFIGKDFGLTNSVSVEFDLKWEEQFTLIVPVYTSTIDRFSFNSGSYIFYLRPGYVSLQRARAGVGTMNLGVAQVPELADAREARIQLRANRVKGTLALLLDGKLVHQWKDPNGFAAEGSGIGFYAQMHGSRGQRLEMRNMKIAEWDGRYEPMEPVEVDPEQDMVYFINEDRVEGRILDLDMETVRLEVFGRELRVPLERVTRIVSGFDLEPATEGAPWRVRADFSGGGAVTFEMEGWSVEQVEGRSSNFGLLAFEPKAIREIEFNLDRPRRDPNLTFEDEDIWDFE